MASPNNSAVDLSADELNSESEQKGGASTPEYVKRTARLFESPRVNGTEKKPSYLGLSCSISGYGGMTTYDSKLREGFRSREHSPGRFGASPGTDETDSACATNGYQVNGFANGIHASSPAATATRESARKFMADILSSSKENSAAHHTSSTWEHTASTLTPVAPSKADKDSISTTEVSEIHSSNTDAISPSNKSETSPSKVRHKTGSRDSLGISGSSEGASRSPGTVRVVEFTQTKHYVQMAQDGAMTETADKSFIQQRVERLYGPGALAQGFFRRTRQQQQLQNSEAEENSSLGDKSSGPSLPVLRHLRPEFRAQLAVGPSVKRTPEKQLPAKTVLPEEKDGHYYIRLLQQETRHLLDLAAGAEAELQQGYDLPEEAQGILRSAAGQARLLVRQKLQQFEGLCHKNLSQGAGEPFPTTSEDLAGFWDMVLLQVEQVHGTFAHIATLRASSWQEVNGTEKESTAAPKRRVATNAKRSTLKKAAPGGQEARRAREEARRKMMEERRRAMRDGTTQETSDVQIFTPVKDQ